MARTKRAPGSTFWKRRLGTELRRLRETTAQVTADEAGERMEWNRQKIWRIEKGDQDLRIMDVRNMCQVYGANEETTEALAGLGTKAQSGDWWYSYGDAIPAWFNVYLGPEEVAIELRSYEAELIPGILQTDRYARVVINGPAGPDDPDEAERKAEARGKRQATLTRRQPAPPNISAVLNEAVLRRTVGGTDIMAEQLRSLLAFMDLPNVTIRILPFTAGRHGGMNAGEWVIMRFPPDTEPTIVFYEGLTGAVYLDKPRDVDRYDTVFADLVNLSLDVTGSRKMIGAAMKEFEG